jgi:hypothetical protein
MSIKFLMAEFYVGLIMHHEYMYNNQPDALFILSLLNYHTIPWQAWVEWSSTPLHPGLPTVNLEV